MRETIHTYTGKEIDPFSITQYEVTIEDLAHHLSFICRFGGATKLYYSVAQHCVEVAKRMSPDLRLYGLLHDGSEALMGGDICTPIKHSYQFHFYRSAESAVQAAVYNRFGLPAEEPDELHRIDQRVMLTENRDLMAIPIVFGDLPYPETIIPLGPLEAEQLFLETFHKLEVGEDI